MKRFSAGLTGFLFLCLFLAAFFFSFFFFRVQKFKHNKFLKQCHKYNIAEVKKWIHVQEVWEEE